MSGAIFAAKAKEEGLSLHDPATCTPRKIKGEEPPDELEKSKYAGRESTLGSAAERSDSLILDQWYHMPENSFS